MYEILEKRTLNANTTLMKVHAPFVAKKAQPGQFIILRVDKQGERIPLTIAEYDREAGTITIIFQSIGASTMKLALLEEGQSVHDFVGPLGRASELEGLKKVAVVGGGLGCAIAYPQAKALHEMGCQVDLIAGFRNKDIIIGSTQPISLFTYMTETKIVSCLTKETSASISTLPLSSTGAKLISNPISSKNNNGS